MGTTHVNLWIPGLIMYATVHILLAVTCVDRLIEFNDNAYDYHTSRLQIVWDVCVAVLCTFERSDGHHGSVVMAVIKFNTRISMLNQRTLLTGMHRYIAIAPLAK